MGELIKKWESEQFDKAGIPVMYGALELAKMEIPPKRWIIKGVLPVGVTHFAGKEKMFKSFAALGLCIAVCDGSNYLGFPTEKSKSLYFDMESSESRPHDRLNLISRTMPLSDDCYVITANNLKNENGVMLTLDNGFDKKLCAILEKFAGIKLVVIDVFSKIRSRRKGGEDTYSWDYRDVSVLKDIAEHYDVAIIIVNHIVKGDVYEDDFDSARGSGINAAVDCIWLLKKDKNSERSGVLKIKGRDVESQEYNIQFNTDAFVWERFDTSADVLTQQLLKDYERSNIRQTLEIVMKWGAIWEGSPKDLIQASYKTDTAIALDPKQLGQALSKFEALLREDGFTFTKHRESKGTIYRFVNNNKTLT